MGIEKAYEVLNKYYSRNDLNNMYRAKGFDGSESDTIKKHQYNAELLAKEARMEKDKERKEEIYLAATAFEKLAESEYYNV